MKSHSLIWPLVLFISSLSAAPEFRGPLPAEQREHIHFLADHHKELTRKVEITPRGYKAITTSKNAELVKRLHAHVAYMEKRLDSGAMVRRWDPAYAEMVEHYDDLDARMTPTRNGLQVEVQGKTPRAIKVARNHANIVTSFVKEGHESVSREHPDTVELDENKKVKPNPEKRQ